MVLKRELERARSLLCVCGSMCRFLRASIPGEISSSSTLCGSPLRLPRRFTNPPPAGETEGATVARLLISNGRKIPLRDIITRRQGCGLLESLLFCGRMSKNVPKTAHVCPVSPSMSHPSAKVLLPCAAALGDNVLLYQVPIKPHASCSKFSRRLVCTSTSSAADNVIK